MSAAKKKTKPKSNPRSAPFWRNHLPEALILLVLPFVLYGTSLGFDYVRDDKIVLTENSFVQQGFAGIADIFQTESFTGYLQGQQDLVAGARYRPLSIATFAIEQELWGTNAALSHLLNIVFYMLTVLLLFRVLHQFIRVPDDRPWFRTIPFLPALLFLVHPVHTYVVATLKGRDEILALLLSLASLYYVFRYLRSKKYLDLGLALVTFFLGILAKETTLAFLGVIPLALLLFTRIPQKRYVQILAPLTGVVVLYLLISLDVVGYQFTDKELTGTFPHPLTHDYYPYHIPIMSWGDPAVLISLVANLALIGLAIWQWKQNRLLTFSIGFYYLTLVLTSNLLFPVGTFMTERFLFFPTVGVCLVLAWFFLRWLPEKLGGSTMQTVGLAVIGVMTIGFSVKTFTRVPAWENEMTLNAAAIEVSVNSARANQYYAYSLYEVYKDNSATARANGEPVDKTVQRDLLDQALPHVTTALTIHPAYPAALKCKGGIMAGYVERGADMKFVLD